MAEKKERKKEKGPEKPVFAKPEIDIAGEKGKYLASIWTLDKSGKAMSGVVIKVRFGNEAQPKFRMTSSEHFAIEIPIEFSTEKLKTTFIVGHKKEERELSGPEQKKEVKLPENLKGHGIKAFFHTFFKGDKE